MNHTIPKFLLAIGFAMVLSQEVQADTRGVSCSGCSEAQMNFAARSTTESGIVYVFNDRYRTVNKYQVFSETLGTWPGTSWTTAVKVATEWRLKRDWRSWLEAVEALTEPGTIPLPVDFPVRSVAGVILDPAHATTSIEDFLMNLSGHEQAILSLNTLVGRLTRLKLPIVDLRDIVRTITLRFEFPDGSTMDFSVEFSLNQISLRARTELTPEGNARLADGSAAPSSAIAFRNLEFEDNGGSLIEWIELARSYDVTIRNNGSGLPTTMQCWIESSDIHCIVATRD